MCDETGVGWPSSRRECGDDIETTTVIPRESCGRRERGLSGKQTERPWKPAAVRAADSGQGVPLLLGPAAGIGSCCLCPALGSAIPITANRPDADPGPLATEAAAAASVLRWPGPVSSESWTRSAPLRRRTKA